MDINLFFKSVVELDEQAIILCDINHTIVYMNKAACERYKKRGGKELIGKNLLDCHNSNSIKIINEVLNWFKSSVENNKYFTYHNPKPNSNDDVYMVAIRDEIGNLIGYYEKFENKTLHK